MAALKHNLNVKQTCLVILPSNSELSTNYDAIYAPAIDDAGLKPIKAANINQPATIAENLWPSIEKAKVILADLTTPQNGDGQKQPDASVYYKLGLANGVSKPVILVANTWAEIPLDLRGLEVVIFDIDEPKWSQKLKRKITQSIREVLEEPERATLPIGIKKNETQKEREAKAREASTLSIKSQLERDIEEKEEQVDNAGIEHIKEQLDELKKEIREYKASENAPKNPATWPKDILQTVRSMLRQGGSKLDIYRELRDQGYTNTEAFEIFEAAQID